MTEKNGRKEQYKHKGQSGIKSKQNKLKTTDEEIPNLLKKKKFKIMFY